MEGMASTKIKKKIILLIKLEIGLVLSLVYVYFLGLFILFSILENSLKNI